MLTFIHGKIVHREFAMTKDALEIKRTFMRYISHEIRTPLNTVVMGLKMLEGQLQKSVSKAELLVSIRDMRTSCDVAVDTLNDFLLFDKLENGLMTLEVEKTPAGTVIADAIQPFQIQARALGINLSIEHEVPVQVRTAVIAVDVNKISQVIRNLVSNALKFSPKNSNVKVAISCFTITANKATVPWLRVAVTDTGAGISKENQEKLFKAVIQFNPGKLQKGQGSGLGLWISKGIVDKHCGRLYVHSDGEGHGCTFFLELPISHFNMNLPPELQSDLVAATTDAGRASINGRRVHPGSIELGPNSPIIHMASRTGSTASRLNSLLVPVRDDRPDAHPGTVVPFESKDGESRDLNQTRILIVDDAASNRKMLSRWLRLNDFHVTEASDGLEAVSAVEKSMASGQLEFDAVLMDYQMPNLDGPSAAKQMRETLGFTSVIVGVTGNALPQDIETYLSAGANKVLLKPVDLEQLKSLLLSFTIRPTGGAS